MSIKINLAATVVNTTTDGQQDSPDVTALSDGGFVVAWVSHTDASTPDPYLDSDIMAQVFAADGSKLGGELTLHGGDAAWDIDPSLAPLEDGGFVASWSNSGVKYNQLLSGFFDASGSPSGDELSVVGSYGPTDTVALDDGRTLVLWTDFGLKGAATSTIGVNGVIYNADGTVDVPEFEVNGDWRNPWGYESVNDAHGAALADGSFAVVFQNTSSRDEDGSTSIWLRLFNADGTPAGDEYQPQTTTAGADSEPEIASLADGGFVVVWRGWDDGSGSCIRAQVFEADGTQRGAELQVNTQTFGTQDAPAVVGLEDGGFLVTWSNNNSSSGNGLMGQLFEADGSRYGVELVLSDWYDPTLGTHDSALTRLEDGTIAIVSTENAATDPDVFLALFDPDRLIMGTSDEDSLRGTLLRDRILGFAGDDNLLGRDGNDRLTGGTGADTLSGGRGRDRLEGNLGGDLLEGDLGNDVLLGGAGRDQLYGGVGDDRLVGGLGNDRMWGEGGADTFVYSSGTDRVVDFDLMEDRLEIDPALWGGTELSAAEIVDLAAVEDGNIVFDFGGGDMLILKGITDTAALADALVI